MKTPTKAVNPPRAEQVYQWMKWNGGGANSSGVGIANIELGGLAPGHHRELSPGEIVGLKQALDGRRPVASRPKAKRGIRNPTTRR